MLVRSNIRNIRRVTMDLFSRKHTQWMCNQRLLLFAYWMSCVKWVTWEHNAHLSKRSNNAFTRNYRPHNMGLYLVSLLYTQVHLLNGLLKMCFRTHLLLHALTTHHTHESKHTHTHIRIIYAMQIYAHHRIICLKDHHHSPLHSTSEYSIGAQIFSINYPCPSMWSAAALWFVAVQSCCGISVWWVRWGIVDVVLRPQRRGETGSSFNETPRSRTHICRRVAFEWWQRGTCIFSIWRDAGKCYRILPYIASRICGWSASDPTLESIRM